MIIRNLIVVLAVLAVAPSSRAEEGSPPALRPKANISAEQVMTFKPGVYEVPESHGLLLTLVAPGAFKMPKERDRPRR
jgi:hypothetical protein